MKFKSKLFLLKEYIKKKFDLWNYDEKAKINEIQYIINYLKENHLNNIGNTHIDLGGGNGLYSYRMHQEGFLPETEVVDYYVEQQFNFQHYKVQLENLNLKKKYNIITCMLVLELVNDRDKIIESISRLADRDTIIIFSFPNINSIEHKLWRKKIKDIDDNLSNLFLEKQSLFTIETIRNEFNKFNMEIIEEQKLINLPVYSTNPKIRMNRNIYDNLNLELDGFVEPSTVVCIAKLKEKK